MRNFNLVPLFAFSLLVSACGGGGGKSNPPPASSAASTSSAVSSSIVATSSSADSTSVATSSSSLTSSSLATSSSTSSVASSASSSAPAIVTADMTAGWRGNGTGNTGVTYTNDGVSFIASASDVGAVFDVPKPTQLEDAVITMVVNVSTEFKASGADLQIFAQVKNTWAGEWNCWSANGTVTAGADATLTCTVDEADDRFNQSANDVQVGVQAKGTPTGVVTIKSVKIAMAATGVTSSSSSNSSLSSAASTSSYAANVDHLKALATFPIGASVSNNDAAAFNILTNTNESAIVEKHFSQVTAGNIMKVSYMHPTNNGNANDFTFANADAFVDYAKSKNLTVHGHALIWHSDYQVPAFMKNWSNSDSAGFLTMLDTHVDTIVKHFAAKGNLVSWDVVNEAINDSTPANFRTDSAFYVKSGNSPVYIERAFKAARAADANVELYYNDYNIDQNNAKTTKVVEMVTDFKARNIPITGVGFQMHVFMDYPSIENIKAAMKKVADVGLKVKITELDVAINNPYSSGWSVSKATAYNNASAFAQKKRYCDIVAGYKAVVPEAQRGGITVWGTTDANTWLTTATSQYNGQALAWPLLFDNNYNDKPALRGFADGLLGNACTNL